MITLYVAWHWPDGELIEGEELVSDHPVEKLDELVDGWGLKEKEPGFWYHRSTLEDGSYREVTLSCVVKVVA